MDNTTPGVSSTVIKHKMALRPVQNCNIFFNNVLLTECTKLPKAVDFNSVNVVLKHSRLFVCWIAAGIAMGSYDHAIRYTTSRKQFGQPIAGKNMGLFRVPADSGETGEDAGQCPSYSVDVLQDQ